MTEQHHVKQYRVKVGHAEMTVSGDTPADAVIEARRRLGLDMPRLWDVLYQMDAQAFCVDELQ